MLSRTINDPRRDTFLIAIALLVVVALIPAENGSVGEGLVRVIVRVRDGRLADAIEAVERARGSIHAPLPIIEGFVADVPGSLVDRIDDGSVLSVTPDVPVTYEGRKGGGGGGGGGGGTTEEAQWAADANSLHKIVTQVLKADSFWSRGWTGAGVDVALIDTGVVPVNGLTAPGKVVNGPDLSFESIHPEVRYLDTFGHGTHMAGIIAGRDDAVKTIAPNVDRFMGIAPGARLVNIKVGDHEGRTDLSQVLAAIDWVVDHRNDGLNIRVLNMSFGTDGVQPYLTDPFTYAVEQAWKAGIVVVVAAGNSNFGSDEMNNPAYDPYVLAVGAADVKGTRSTLDDVVPSWSASGGLLRNPDVVAPGRSVLGLRNAGSMIDQENPAARAGERFFRGSGTSQAAAVTSGLVALLLSQRPSLTPDQVKSILRSTAKPIPNEPERDQGKGLVDADAVRLAKTPSKLLSTQANAPGTGLGSLETARGTVHVVEDGIALVGERDIFNLAWSLSLLTSPDPDHALWDGDWSATSWTGRSWSGRSWSGDSWSGRSWSGRSWSGRSWSGRSWSGDSWSGRSWSADAWSSAGWS